MVTNVQRDMGFRVPRMFAVVVVAAALGACGDGDVAEPARSLLPDAARDAVPDATAATTTTSSVPGSNPAPATAPAGTLAATTVFVPPSVPPGGLPPIEPVDVTEPCPESAGIGGDGEFGDGVFEEQGRLEPMIGQVLAYGSEHPDQFGSYGLVWHGTGDASVFISFTRDLDVHRAALSERVEYPDELIVCQVPITGAVRQALQAHLVTELDGKFSSLGGGPDGAVGVALTADQEQLAVELDAEYGDAVNLTVGALAYPLDEAVDNCSELPDGVDVAGLSFQVLPPSEPLYAVALDAPNLTARLTNQGSDPIRFDSGARGLGTLLDADERVVSSYVFGQTDVGGTIDLAPGAAIEVPIDISTASCRAELGYVLPPGEYQLVAQFSHIAGGEIGSVVSEPLTVLVGDGG